MLKNDEIQPLELDAQADGVYWLSQTACGTDQRSRRPVPLLLYTLEPVSYMIDYGVISEPLPSHKFGGRAEQKD